MLSKSDWILDLLRKYKRESLQTPIFISDWDALNENASYPKQLIANALNIDVSLTFPYTFSDEQFAIKELIVKDLQKHNVILRPAQLAIAISATAALYLSIISLYKQGQRKFLLFTPVYYSIIDTLKDLNADIFFYNLKDQTEFDVDLVLIEDLIKSNHIDVVLLSDPVYCAGKNIQTEVLAKLVVLCRRYDSWLFLDNTLGGLEWDEIKTGIFNYSKINTITVLEKFVIVDSLTKRMLVNALKHAVIMTSNSLAAEIENFASQVYGGFCFPQLQLMTELYDAGNNRDVINILDHNIQVIKNNYELLKSFLLGSDYSIYNADSGYFTMIAHQRYLCNEVNIEAQVHSYLYNFNSFVLPPWYFNFDETNHFSIRINLLKEPSTYLSALGECIREDMKLFH